MYYVNKIVGLLMSPSAMGLVVLAALVFLRAKRRYLGIVLGLLWFWQSAIPGRILGLPLEREWLVGGDIPKAESFPTADAIVCLGGGMGAAKRKAHGVNMYAGADRAWMAAQLWKAGKAPKIICTGTGCKTSTRDFLLSFGVPEDAMMFLEKARNTEEESRRVQSLMFDVRCSEDRPQTSNIERQTSNVERQTSNVERQTSNIERQTSNVERQTSNAKPKLLLVTSAWHMRRAKLMFEKYAPEVEVIPAPTDFEATVGFDGGFDIRELQPGMAFMNEYYLREWIGYFGYKWVR